MNTDYKTGDQLTIRIEKIVPRGYGLGFVEGLTVFTPLAGSGDLLRVRIDKIKGKIAYAEIEEVLEPSPDRVPPSCAYFGECGGCDMQQLNYGAQLAAKEGILRDCLERIAKISYDGVIEVVGSPREFVYRLRAQWHAEAATGKIGYFRRGSRELINIETCPILLEPLQAKLSDLRQELPRANSIDDRVKLDAAVGDDGRVSVWSNESSVDEPEEIFVDAANERYRFSARTFFQGNRAMIDRLIEAAVGGESGSTALDLYSGVGLFTLPLARRFERVTGIEEGGEAVEFARFNAATAGLANVEFERFPVRKFLSMYKGSPPDLILLDPPRFGTERETIMDLIRIGPLRVSYVACEPSVLARDLKRFVENRYRIDSIKALDMFPQTHHVETVVKLIKE